jgi:hypothetical protein
MKIKRNKIEVRIDFLLYEKVRAWMKEKCR